MLLMQNVKGFEVSACCERFCQVLQDRGYLVRQYLLTPAQCPFRVPNERLRYYLVATLRGQHIIPPPPPVPVSASVPTPQKVAIHFIFFVVVRPLPDLMSRSGQKKRQKLCRGTIVSPLRYIHEANKTNPGRNCD